MCNCIAVYKFILMICEHDYKIRLLGYLSAVKLCYSCVYNIIELLGVRCALNRIIALYITPFWENNGFARLFSQNGVILGYYPYLNVHSEEFPPKIDDDDYFR